MNKAVVLAIWLALLVPRPAYAVQPPSAGEPALPSLGVVPIYLSQWRPVAVLRIGEHAPSPVIFDTGTSANDLDSDYAAALKLRFDPTVDVQVGDGTGKTFKAKQAIIPSATLGNLRISEKTATVFPYKERDVVGIFGPSSFVGREVLLDLGHGRLIVRQRVPTTKTRAGSTSYFDDGRPAVPLDLRGMTVPALVDSGSDSTIILPESLATRLPLRGPLRVAGKMSTVTGEQDFFEGEVSGEIRIGALVLKDPTVRFKGSDAPNVGLPLIRRLLIMFDPEKRTSWIVEPPKLSAGELLQFQGRYGVRTITIEKGQLIYQRDGRRPYAVTALAEDLFGIEETGDVLQFWRTSGRVTKMDHVNGAGTLTTAPRSEP